MAIISVNGISGINSITSQSGTVEFYNSSGALASFTGNISGNINASGITTLGIATASQLQVTGLSTFSNIRVTGGTISGVSTAGITTAYIGSVNDGPISGARNRIINGDMRISQRATTATGNYSSVYVYASVDRWAVYSSNTSTTQAQSTDSPTGFQNSFKLQRPSTSTATGILQLVQGIESVNCYDLSSQTVTLSFWAKKGANYSGGNLTADVVTGTTADQGIAIINSWANYATPIYNNAIVLTTAWTRYTITGTFGSGVLEAGVRFSWTPTGTAGADDSIYITGVQLEPGTVATPFERRSYGQELALCQRYYFKTKVIGAGDDIGTGCSLTTTSAQIAIFFPVEMRTNVTSIEQTGTAGDYSVRYPGGAITCSGVPTYYSGTKTHGAVALSVSSGLTAGQGAFLRGQTANAYIAWSTEL